MPKNTKKQTKKIWGLDLGFEVDDRVLKWGGILGAELGLVLILSLLIIAPQIAAIQRANRDLAEEQENLQDLTEKADLLSEFAVEFSASEEVLNNTFPEEQDIGLVVRSIRQISDQAGVEIVTYTVKPGNETGNSTINIPSFGVELTINGTAEGTQNFVNTLDRSLPLKSIDNLSVIRSLVATESGGLQQLIQTKIDLRTYFLPFNVKVDSSRPLSPFGERQLGVLSQLGTYLRPVAISAPDLDNQPTRNPNLFGESE